MSVRQKIARYEATWIARGYPEGIPDEVPEALAAEGLAPSWKAVAIALLKNDMHLTSLGFSAPYSEWYGAIKRAERLYGRPEV